MTTNIEEKELLQDEMERSWKEQEGQHQLLLRLEHESAEAVFGAEKLAVAFAKWPRTLVCVDERVSLADEKDPEIGIAGTLVLMNQRQFELTVEKLRRTGVNKVLYHEGCGACSLFLKSHPEDPRSVIQVAKTAALKVHRALDLIGEPERIGYSQKADYEMTGHPDFHHARAIILDRSGRFNPAVLGIKHIFQASVYYHPDLAYTIKEIEIMQNIAFGDHGFGDKFDTKDPLLVVLVDQDYIDDSKLLPTFGDRIKVLKMSSLGY